MGFAMAGFVGNGSAGLDAGIAAPEPLGIGPAPTSDLPRESYLACGIGLAPGKFGSATVMPRAALACSINRR